MSTGSGDGAALDATGVSVEHDSAWWERRRELERQVAEADGRVPEAWATETARADELRAELAELVALTPEQEANAQRVMELRQALYLEQCSIPGTPAHAAHVAQLRRLRDEAADAVTGANLALEKAREHAAGKEDALGEARAALDGAELALAEVVGPEPDSADDDGSAVL